jgi:hypothetical protein
MSTFVYSVRKLHMEVIYQVAANSSFRHAGMDGRHPVPQDASGYIHVT